MKESVTAYAKIDESRLNARFYVYDSPFVNVSDIRFLTSSLHIELLQDSILYDGYPAFFRLENIDQHFLFHDVRNLSRESSPAIFNRVRSHCGAGKSLELSGQSNMAKISIGLRVPSG